MIMRTASMTAGLALAALLGLAGTAAAQSKTRLIISVAGSGTPSNALGAALASSISQHVRGYSADTDIAASPEDGVKAVGRGKASLVFVASDVAYAASHGEGAFKDGKIALRAIAAINPYRMHVVVFEGSGVSRLADLKGKRIAVAQGTAEAPATRLLEAAGLSADKDLRRAILAPADILAAAKDGTLDAVFAMGSVPVPLARDLAGIPGRTTKLIDSAGAVDAVNKKYGPLYTRGSIPAKTYPGQAAAVGAAESWVILAGGENLSAPVAYNVAKTLFEHKAMLAAMHSDAANLSLPKQREVRLPIAFHPGALKYFAEKGVRAGK
jgi:uncharacterized protein